MRKTNRIIAAVTLFFFLATDVGRTAPGFVSELPGNVKDVNIKTAFDFSLPADLGTIETQLTGNGPALVHIQSAHGNFEGEKKIQSLLHHLKNEYGFEHLLLEGAISDLDPERLRLFPGRSDLTMEAADKLTREALVTGSELFLLEQGNAKGYGIESLEDYEAAGKSFLEVLIEQEKVTQFLGDLDLQIKRLASPHLSAELRGFLREQAQYEAETLDFSDWLSVLKEKGIKHLEIDVADAKHQMDWPMLFRVVKLKKFEEKIDLKAFETERERFLLALQGAPKKTRRRVKMLLSSPLSGRQLPDPETGLFFEGLIRHLPRDFTYEPFRNVAYFIGHLILQSEVSGERLMTELEQLTDEVAVSMAETAEAKQILGLLKDYKLLKKLFALELTPSEHEVIINRPLMSLRDRGPNQVEAISGLRNSEIASGASRPRNDEHGLAPSRIAKQFLSLNNDNRVRNTQFSHLDEIDIYFEKALAFYAGVKARDTSMLRNIESRLKELNTNKAVIVTGGFHAEPFKNYFKRAGYHYALIAPKITTESNREAYIKSGFLKSAHLLKPSTHQFRLISDISHNLPPAITARLGAIRAQERTSKQPRPKVRGLKGIVEQLGVQVQYVAAPASLSGNFSGEKYAHVYSDERRIKFFLAKDGTEDLSYEVKFKNGAEGAQYQDVIGLRYVPGSQEFQYHKFQDPVGGIIIGGVRENPFRSVEFSNMQAKIMLDAGIMEALRRNPKFLSWSLSPIQGDGSDSAAEKALGVSHTTQNLLLLVPERVLLKNWQGSFEFISERTRRQITQSEFKANHVNLQLRGTISAGEHQGKMINRAIVGRTAEDFVAAFNRDALSIFLGITAYARRGNIIFFRHDPVTGVVSASDPTQVYTWLQKVNFRGLSRELSKVFPEQWGAERAETHRDATLDDDRAEQQRQKNIFYVGLWLAASVFAGALFHNWNLVVNVLLPIHNAADGEIIGIKEDLMYDPYWYVRHLKNAISSAAMGLFVALLGATLERARNEGWRSLIPPSWLDSYARWRSGVGLAARIVIDVVTVPTLFVWLWYRYVSRGYGIFVLKNYEHPAFQRGISGWLHEGSYGFWASNLTYTVLYGITGALAVLTSMLFTGAAFKIIGSTWSARRRDVANRTFKVYEYLEWSRRTGKTVPKHFAVHAARIFALKIPIPKNKSWESERQFLDDVAPVAQQLVYQGIAAIYRLYVRDAATFQGRYKSMIEEDEDNLTLTLEGTGWDRENREAAPTARAIREAEAQLVERLRNRFRDISAGASISESEDFVRRSTDIAEDHGWDLTYKINLTEKIVSVRLVVPKARAEVHHVPQISTRQYMLRSLLSFGSSALTFAAFAGAVHYHQQVFAHLTLIFGIISVASAWLFDRAWRNYKENARERVQEIFGIEVPETREFPPGTTTSVLGVSFPVLALGLWALFHRTLEFYAILAILIPVALLILGTRDMFKFHFVRRHWHVLRVKLDEFDTIARRYGTTFLRLQRLASELNHIDGLGIEVNNEDLKVRDGFLTSLHEKKEIYRSITVRDQEIQNQIEKMWDQLPRDFESADEYKAVLRYFWVYVMAANTYVERGRSIIELFFEREVGDVGSYIIPTEEIMKYLNEMPGPELFSEERNRDFHILLSVVEEKLNVNLEILWNHFLELPDALEQIGNNIRGLLPERTDRAEGRSWQMIVGTTILIGLLIWQFYDFFWKVTQTLIPALNPNPPSKKSLPLNELGSATARAEGGEGIPIGKWIQTAIEGVQGVVDWVTSNAATIIPLVTVAALLLMAFVFNRVSNEDGDFIDELQAELQIDETFPTRKKKLFVLAVVLAVITAVMTIFSRRAETPSKDDQPAPAQPAPDKGPPARAEVRAVHVAVTPFDEIFALQAMHTGGRKPYKITYADEKQFKIGGNVRALSPKSKGAEPVVRSVLSVLTGKEFVTRTMRSPTPLFELSSNAPSADQVDLLYQIYQGDGPFNKQIGDGPFTVARFLEVFHISEAEAEAAERITAAFEALGTKDEEKRYLRVADSNEPKQYARLKPDAAEAEPERPTQPTRSGPERKPLDEPTATFVAIPESTLVEKSVGRLTTRTRIQTLKELLFDLTRYQDWGATPEEYATDLHRKVVVIAVTVKRSLRLLAAMGYAEESEPGRFRVITQKLNHFSNKRFITKFLKKDPRRAEVRTEGLPLRPGEQALSSLLDRIEFGDADQTGADGRSGVRLEAAYREIPVLRRVRSRARFQTHFEGPLDRESLPLRWAQASEAALNSAARWLGVPLAHAEVLPALNVMEVAGINPKSALGRSLSAWPNQTKARVIGTIHLSERTVSDPTGRKTRGEVRVETFDPIVLKAHLNPKLVFALAVVGGEAQFETFQTQLTAFARARYGVLPTNLELYQVLATANLARELQKIISLSDLPTGIANFEAVLAELGYQPELLRVIADERYITGYITSYITDLLVLADVVRLKELTVQMLIKMQRMQDITEDLAEYHRLLQEAENHLAYLTAA